MTNRLSASALKELQINLNEARLAQVEQQRMKDRSLAHITKIEKTRRDKIEKQWKQQTLNIIREAASGKFHFDAKGVIWPNRLIYAGFGCYHHDIRELEAAIASSEVMDKEIDNQITKVQSKVMKLLHKQLLIQFNSIEKVRELFEQAVDELVTDIECDSFTKALSVTNSKFRRIDQSPAAEQLGQLDQLYDVWLNNYFKLDRLNEQLDFENDGGIYDKDALDRPFPSLISISLSVDGEQIAAKSGASIRIGWNDVSQNISKIIFSIPNFR
jgi:hypothetical protein